MTDDPICCNDDHGHCTVLGISTDHAIQSKTSPLAHTGSYPTIVPHRAASSSQPVDFRSDVITATQHTHEWCSDHDRLSADSSPLTSPLEGLKALFAIVYALQHRLSRKQSCVAKSGFRWLLKRVRPFPGAFVNRQATDSAASFHHI